MPDVYLLTEGQEGEVAVPHLTLTFLDSGLALREGRWRARLGQRLGRARRAVTPGAIDSCPTAAPAW